MDQSMARSSTLDLSETNKVTSFEIAISMLKLPQRRVGRSGVKHIAHYNPTSTIVLMFQVGKKLTLVKPVHIQLPDEGGDISVLEVLTVGELVSWQVGKNGKKLALTLKPWRIQRLET